MSFQPINLAALAVPPAIQSPSFAAILTARLAAFLSYYQAAQAANSSLPDIDAQTLALVTDPANIHQRVDSYRETLLVQSINDAQLNTFLAWAEGPALDAIAAFVNVTRAANELDPSLRSRAQLAWEALSIGGTYGRYIFNALSAAPVELAGVAVYGAEVSPVPKGGVWIVCLGSNASGIPSPATLALVNRATNSRGNRPVNDLVKVFAVNPAYFMVTATLHLAGGADPATVVAAQGSALQAFLAGRRRIGAFVDPGDVKAVLGFTQAGLVTGVDLRAPATRVGGSPFEAPVLLTLNLTWSRGCAP